MPFNPDQHRRRSIRLSGYDYRQDGAYAVTHHRQCLFGDVVNGEVLLSTVGCVVETCWESIPQNIAYVELDTFVVMPNHLHGILVIHQNADVQNGPKSGVHLGGPDQLENMVNLGEAPTRPDVSRFV